jgi:WD40 repeat protein
VSAICVRKDGNVFAAADESGKIEIMDLKEKFHLRSFYNHKKRVNALEYY